MPTYEYETIPSRQGEKPERFEIYQPITAAAITKHPDTGVPVRRVISGGLGIFTESRVSEKGPPPCASGGCGLGQGGGCDFPQAGGCAGGMCGL
jgi:predicted nucleic acid-binding Zn ribbon protein